MDSLNWEPGRAGKGVVDQEGNVHTWDDDDYEVHHDYISQHPNIGGPLSYFYIEPNGEIEITFPSAHVEGQQAHDLMMEHICEVDPHFHAAKKDAYFFGTTRK
jgi:hypothetical protein